MSECQERLPKHYWVMNINATEITLLYLEDAQNCIPVGTETLW